MALTLHPLHKPPGCISIKCSTAVSAHVDLNERCENDMYPVPADADGCGGWMRMRGKWQRRNVFIAHWSLEKKKRGGVGCSTSARTVSDGEGHHFFRKHSFKFLNPVHYSADCEKVAAFFFFFYACPIYLVYAGVGVWCLTFHMFGLFFTFFAHPSLFSGGLACHAQGVVKGQKVCVAIWQLLAGWLCHSVVGHHFKYILCGWLDGKLLFYRLWLASAGQWKMASQAPPTRFQHCSGHEIVCVCVFVRKPCISILYLSLVMSRELWQRPTVAFCL